MQGYKYMLNQLTTIHGKTQAIYCTGLKRVNIVTCKLPESTFNKICDDESMRPDSLGYPLLPNEFKQWSFKHSILSNNALNHFSEWAMKRRGGKTRAKSKNCGYR